MLKDSRKQGRKQVRIITGRYRLWLLPGEYDIIYPWDEVQEGGTVEKGTEWLSVYNKDTNNGITENLGTHNGSFYLKATANETGEASTAKIKILDTATYTSSATITITQAAAVTE